MISLQADTVVICYYIAGKFCQFTVVHKKPVTNPANTMNNLTAEACRKTCDGRPNCESFTYNFTNSMCSLHGAGAVDLTDSDTTNYYVKTCSDRSGILNWLLTTYYVKTCSDRSGILSWLLTTYYVKTCHDK